MVAGPVKKHERDRRTARTMLVLHGLILTAGNRMPGRDGDEGDVPIRVPAQTARDIHALARDVLVHGARKARLDPVEVAT